MLVVEEVKSPLLLTMVALAASLVCRNWTVAVSLVVSVAWPALLSSWKKVKASSLVVMLAVAAVLEPAKVVVALSLVRWWRCPR